MGADAGTHYDVGWGAMFGRPSTDYVRETEGKYLPQSAQRDYDNNAHVEEHY
jgi:methylisocitrate lyase